MAKLCGADHPTLPITCHRPGEGPQGNHEEHTAVYYEEYIDWPNEDYAMVPRRGRMAKTDRKAGLRLREIAERIRK